MSKMKRRLYSSNTSLTNITEDDAEVFRPSTFIWPISFSARLAGLDWTLEPDESKPFVGPFVAG